MITMNEVGHLLSTRVNRKKPMMLNARWNSTRRSDRGERGRLHGFKPLGVDLFEEGYHSRLPVLPHGEVSFQEFLKSKSLDQQRGFFGSLTRVHIRSEDPHRCLMDPTRDALDQHPVDLVSEHRRQRKKGLRGRERIQGCSMTAWNLVTQSLRSRDSLRRATLDLQERKERNPKTYYEWCGHRLRRSPRKRV